MVTDERDRQLANARNARMVTLCGMTTDESDVPENAAVPIMVTLFGMVTEEREEQPSNAPSIMIVKEFGMVTCPSSSG
jgi:hypothetical protein